MRSGTKHHRVTQNFFRNGNLVGGFSHGEKIFAGTNAVRGFFHRLLSHGDYAHEFVEVRVFNYKFEHKTVHLRFRKRISTVLLYRVLRCENEEGFVKFSRHAHNRNGMLLHRFEKCRLRFRRGTVDFVGKHNVGKGRSGMEVKLRCLHIKHRCAENIARHEVGSELHTRETRVEWTIGPRER